MDNKELLIAIGDLYLQKYMLIQDLIKKENELEELRKIIVSLQKKNGQIS